MSSPRDTPPAPRLGSFWAHAGSFGALWGAVEATLGSFLHTMQIPFAGVFLASFGAALLVALRLLVPRPGILLATGAICAGIKLLSPGTVLLGPAIGILTESLLAELVCLPLGANVVAASLAGALAALWAVTQKVLTQVVLYGAPMLGIYKELLRRAELWLGLSPRGGIRVVLFFVALMGLVGAVAGWLGRRAGQRALQRTVQPLRLDDSSVVSAPRRDATASRTGALITSLLCASTLALLVVLAADWHALVMLGLGLGVAIAARPFLGAVGSARSWVLAFCVLAVLGAVLGPKPPGAEGWSSTFSARGALSAVTMITRALALVLWCRALFTLLPRRWLTGHNAFGQALYGALQTAPKLSAMLDRRMRPRGEPMTGNAWNSAPRRLLDLFDEAVGMAHALALSPVHIDAGHPHAPATTSAEAGNGSTHD